MTTCPLKPPLGSLNAFLFSRVSDKLAKLQVFSCAVSWTEGRPAGMFSAALWSTSSWILSLPTDKDRTEISVIIWHVMPVRPGERSLSRRVMCTGSPLSCNGMGRIKSAEWESLGRGWPGDCRRLAAGAVSAVTCCEITVTLLSVTRGGSATEMPRAFFGSLSWCLEMEWRGLYESVLSSTVRLEQTWQCLHCPRGGAQTISDLSPCRISRSSVSVSSIMIPWELFSAHVPSESKTQIREKWCLSFIPGVFKHQNLNAEDKMPFLSLFFNDSGCAYTCLILAIRKELLRTLFVALACSILSLLGSHTTCLVKT